MGALSGDPGTDREEGASEDGEPATFDQLLRRAAAARSRHREGRDHVQPGAADEVVEDGTDQPGGPPN